MEFRLMKIGRPIAAASAFALWSGLMTLPAKAQEPAQAPPAGQQPAGAQPAAGGQKPAKNYKDRGEYEVYDRVVKATSDPKAQVAALQEWQDKYPQSDYAPERNQYWLLALSKLAQTDPAAKQQLVTKASEIFKADPKNFRAAYLVAAYGPQIGGQSPTPELQSQVHTAAQAVLDLAPETFDPSKKPANVPQEQFDQAKTQAQLIASKAMIWEATSKKDNAAIGAAYKAALQASPNQAALSAEYAKFLVNDKKMPEGLFEYARAAQYDGPGALPPATRQQLLDYFNKAYAGYHGSEDGKQQMMDQAKSQALPPDGMQLTSAQDMANKNAAALQSRIDSDPAFKIWYAIKQSLQEKGDSYLANDLKNVEIPGESVPDKAFSGTIITVDPNRVTIGVEDPAKPDATLEFSKPLPAAAMEKVKVGEKIQFSGIADSFVKEPYMLTIKDPTIPGVQTAAPAKKGTARKR